MDVQLVVEERSNNEERREGTSAPVVLRRSLIASETTSDERQLRFLFLGCEDEPPYGPTEHTATLFLELIAEALSECARTCNWDVVLAVYRVKQDEYPQCNEWDSYDGIILPGSFSTAYDRDPWIEKLKHVIQEEIVMKHRPTLAICFGHQVLAHSFADGRAKKYSKGTRGGRYKLFTTNIGSKFFGGEESINLYYTHSDMVEKLPPCALALGYEAEGLPCQSAAYFKDEKEKEKFQSGDFSVKPFAVTFQAHPEYSVSRELGLRFTVERILAVMEEKCLIDSEFHQQARNDAEANFDVVHRQSKDAFIASARALGWFP